MRIERLTRLLLALVLTVSFAAACKSNKEQPTPTTSAAPAEKADKVDKGENIKIFNAEGKAILKLKEKKYGYKLVSLTGESQKSAGKLRVTEGVYTLEDPDGKNIYKISSKDSQIRLEDGEGKALFNAVLKGSDLEVQDAQNKPIYRVKPDGEGYKITDEKDQMLSRVKRTTNRMILESAAGKQMMDVKGLDSPLAAAAMALEKLNEQQRATFMVMLARHGKK